VKFRLGVWLGKGRSLLAAALFGLQRKDRGLKSLRENSVSRTPAAEAGLGGVIYGTAETMPFGETELSRGLSRPRFLASYGNDSSRV
jgi:hypothetical protein